MDRTLLNFEEYSLLDFEKVQSWTVKVIVHPDDTLQPTPWSGINTHNTEDRWHGGGLVLQEYPRPFQSSSPEHSAEPKQWATLGAEVTTSEGTQGLSYTGSVVAWRARGPRIWLVEAGLDEELRDYAVQLEFPAPLVEGSISAFEYGLDQEFPGVLTGAGLCLCAVSRAGLAYRVCFPYPRLLLATPAPSRRTVLSSVFASNKRQLRLDSSYHPGSMVAALGAQAATLLAAARPGDTPTLHWVSPELLAVGSDDGALYCLSLPSPISEAMSETVGAPGTFELRDHTIMQRLWKGLVGQSTAEGQKVLACTSVPGEANRYLLSLTDDGYLRVWDTVMQQCITTPPQAMVTATSKADGGFLRVTPVPVLSSNHMVEGETESMEYLVILGLSFGADTSLSAYSMQLVADGEVSQLVQCTRLKVPEGLSLKHLVSLDVGVLGQVWSLWNSEHREEGSKIVCYQLDLSAFRTQLEDGSHPRQLEGVTMFTLEDHCKEAAKEDLTLALSREMAGGWEALMAQYGAEDLDSQLMKIEQFYMRRLFIPSRFTCSELVSSLQQIVPSGVRPAPNNQGSPLDKIKNDVLAAMRGWSSEERKGGLPWSQSLSSYSGKWAKLLETCASLSAQSLQPLALICPPPEGSMDLLGSPFALRTRGLGLMCQHLRDASTGGAQRSSLAAVGEVWAAASSIEEAMEANQTLQVLDYVISTASENGNESSWILGQVRTVADQLLSLSFPIGPGGNSRTANPVVRALGAFQICPDQVAALDEIYAAIQEKKQTVLLAMRRETSSSGTGLCGLKSGWIAHLVTHGLRKRVRHSYAMARSLLVLLTALREVGAKAFSPAGLKHLQSNIIPDIFQLMRWYGLLADLCDQPMLPAAPIEDLGLASLSITPESKAGISVIGVFVKEHIGSIWDNVSRQGSFGWVNSACSTPAPPLLALRKWRLPIAMVTTAVMQLGAITGVGPGNWGKGPTGLTALEDFMRKACQGRTLFKCLDVLMGQGILPGRLALLAECHLSEARRLAALGHPDSATRPYFDRSLRLFLAAAPQVPPLSSIQQTETDKWAQLTRDTVVAKQMKLVESGMSLAQQQMLQELVLSESSLCSFYGDLLSERPFQQILLVAMNLERVSIPQFVSDIHPIDTNQKKKGCLDLLKALAFHSPLFVQITLYLRALKHHMRTSSLLAQSNAGTSGTKGAERTLETLFAAVGVLPPKSLPYALAVTTPTACVLWSAIFKNCLECRRHGEALSAACSNPDPDRRRDNLAHLVARLCERGRVAELCELPLTGNEQAVEKILQSNAEQSNVGDMIHGSRGADYYTCLYVFLLTKGNYRKAALVMNQYYNRLENEALPASDAVIRKQIQTLLCIKSALDMIPEEQRYLTLYEDRSTSQNERDGQSTDEYTLLPDIKVVSKKDIEKKLSLMTAWTEITKAKGGNNQAFKASPEDTLAILNDAGLYSSALKLALAHGLPLSQIVGSLATRCSKLQADAEEAGSSLSKGPHPFRRRRDSEFHPPFSSAVGSESSTRTKELWHLLQIILQNFDYQENSESLHNLAVESILVAQSNAALPLWLVDSFLPSSRPSKRQKCSDLSTSVGNQADASLLLCRFIQYNYLEQACNFLCQILQRFTEQYRGLDLHPEMGNIEWISYNTIDNLLNLCEEKKVDSNKVESKIREYFEFVLRNDHAIGLPY